MSDQYDSYETYSRDRSYRVPGSEWEPGERTSVMERVPVVRTVTAPSPPVRTQTIIRNGDALTKAMAVSQLIWTIVWSLVVLVLLAVLLDALHVYAHLF